MNPILSFGIVFLVAIALIAGGLWLAAMAIRLTQSAQRALPTVEDDPLLDYQPRYTIEITARRRGQPLTIDGTYEVIK